MNMMNRNNTQKSTTSRSPLGRRKSPIYLSPRNRGKQSDGSTLGINCHLTETLNQNQNVLKQLQQPPLQFSAGRKLKSKHPPPAYYQNGCTAFINSSVYTYNSNSNFNVGYENSKLNNENKNWESIVIPKNEQVQVDLQKIKNNYEMEIKTILDGQKNVQNQYECRLKNMDKERNYWKQCYMMLKQQFQCYIKAAEHKQKQREQKQKNKQKQKQKQKTKDTNQQFVFRYSRINSASTATTSKAPINQNIQEQITQLSKSLKVAENQIYQLNKEKADLNYENTFYKEQSRKANGKVFQLQYEVDMGKKQIKQLKERIKKNEQQIMAKSMDVKPTNADMLTFSLDNKQISEMSPDKPNNRSHSNSGQKSRSSTDSLNLSGSKYKSSRHSRSHSYHHYQNSSHRSRNQMQQPIQLMPLQINFEQGKQIQRLKHATRKLQKNIHSQNNDIMRIGLKHLNQKYSKNTDSTQDDDKTPYYPQTNKKQKQKQSNYSEKTNDSLIYRYNYVSSTNNNTNKNNSNNNTINDSNFGVTAGYGKYL